MFLRISMLFSISFIILSCQKTSPDPIEVISVEQEFDLSVSQGVSENGSQFLLRVRSVEVSECSNAILDANLVQTGNDIIIQINGNIFNDDCIVGEIYTEKTFELPNTPGQYNIEIIQGELSSTSGSLVIDESNFDLSINNLGGIFYEGQNLKILPEFLAWGYYGDNTPNSTTQTFLEEMAFEIGFNQKVFDLQDGDYSLFRVEAGEIILDDVKIDHVTVAYNVEDDLAWEKLTTLLPTFSTNAPRLKYRFDRWDGVFIEN